MEHMFIVFVSAEPELLNKIVPYVVLLSVTLQERSQEMAQIHPN